MLSKEQEKELKKQILSQLETSLPADQLESTKKYIETLNPEEFEEFLIRNKLIKSNSSSESGMEEQDNNIFRMIAEGKVKSYKIDESPEAIAVLEINPISKGHILIIPKQHLTNIKQLNNSIKKFANKVSKYIKKTYNPKSIQITPKVALNHVIIDIIPQYDSSEIDKEKYTPEKFEKVMQQLTTPSKKIKPHKKTIKKLEKKIEYKFPRRIP